ESKRDDVLINAWNWLIYPDVDKLDRARKLLQQSKKLVDKIVGSFRPIIETSDTVESKLLRAITEYKAYECYLNALMKFNEWFKQSQRSVPSIMENSTDDVGTLMDMQQRITFEVIHQRANEKMQRYENASKQSTTEEVKKLTGIKSRYITAVIIMLVTIFEKSDINRSAQLVELLADEEYKLAEVIPKEQLRILIKQLSVNAYKSL
ncbi:hypothetical protein WUBG_10172, partial [Wuchereria bancrofti]